MNRKEINEIKRFLSSKDRLIKDIYAAYINAERKKISFERVDFTSMSEGEEDEYIKIFKKVLSTDVERKFLNLTFPNGENSNRDRLYKIVKEEDQDHLVEEIFDQIIDHYPNEAAYAIFLMKGIYDVPRKGSDNLILEDSDTTYNFVITAICPIKLSKPKLVYENNIESFAKGQNDWTVAMPDTGFIYPSFTNREMNVADLGFYTRTLKESFEELGEDFLGLEMPEDAVYQKDSFASTVMDAFASQVPISSVISLNEGAKDFIEAKEDEGETGPMKKTDIEDLLRSAGAEDPKVEDGMEVMAENLVEKDYKFIGDGVDIKLSDERIHQVKIREIDGIKYFTLPLGQMDLNGINIK